MQWIVSFVIFAFVAVMIWPEKKHNPIHITWVVPAIFIGLIVIVSILSLII